MLTPSEIVMACSNLHHGLPSHIDRDRIGFQVTTEEWDAMCEHMKKFTKYDPYDLPTCKLVFMGITLTRTLGVRNP
jgi:hypothetical protein